MSAQAQMRALLDQLMGTARDGSVYLCQPTSICKGVAEKPHVHRAVLYIKAPLYVNIMKTIKHPRYWPRSKYHVKERNETKTFPILPPNHLPLSLYIWRAGTNLAFVTIVSISFFSQQFRQSCISEPFNKLTGQFCVT
uniref:Uncharacterized protein n=1 Tax=Denticeps clupeoides TaxID=299321 RepID=A0AAY3ZVR2_9TELE